MDNFENALVVPVLLASTTGQVRLVRLPPRAERSLEDVLNDVFYFGQNDFQPLPLPSVSAGDVIVFGPELFHVNSGCGFLRLSAAEFEDYMLAGHRDRFELVASANFELSDPFEAKHAPL